MLNYKNVNIFFLCFLALLIIVNFYFKFPFLCYPALIIIYLSLIIYGSVRIQADFYLRSECSKATTKRLISLTFDDGPTNMTCKVLDLLKENNIKATFFCIGKNIEAKEDILKRIDYEGHIIGNHSYSHNFWLDFYRSGKIFNELLKTEKIIQNIINKRTLLFRPPYGVTNPNIKKAAGKLNYTSVGWSVRSYDTIRNCKEIIKRINRELKPGGVFLFHDTGEKIIPVLKEFICYVNKNNYKIVRLDELLNIRAYD
jgi:peptidoglycan-N-acetylglucosamine deacetylase